jgi:glycosyltransferase involved in cell wall biosynthesis
MMAAVPKLPMVLAAGRVWDEAKNLRLLDEIAPTLPWPIEIAGNTTHPERGEIALHDARAVGLLDRDALRRHVASAAIYAAPALYEPFGLGILEAAAAGCALLLGDIPSLRENWHAAAILLPPGEPAHWRDAVLRLIDDGDERERLGKAAQAQARRFTLARMADRYRALYRAPYRVVA